MATGSGQSKKKAKHAAAKAVLEKIRAAQTSLHNSALGDKIADCAATSSASSPIAPSSAPALTPVAELAVNFNMDLVLSPQDDGIEGNPIGELQELCMNRRMQPPTYEVCLEEGQPHERRFVIVCTAGSLREEGLGKSKKLAKRQAASKLLRKMQQQPVGDMESGTGANLTAAVLDEDDIAQGLAQRTRDRLTGAATGFLRMHRSLRPREGTKLLWLQSQTSEEATTDLRSQAVSVLEAIGKEQDFDVTFVDIEERSTRGQAHCIVQLATSPVAVCYGVGDSDEDAKSEAAYNALEYLRVMTKPVNEQKTQSEAVE
jgi:RISC-loading complex subunit TARBP2